MQEPVNVQELDFLDRPARHPSALSLMVTFALVTVSALRQRLAHVTPATKVTGARHSSARLDVSLDKVHASLPTTVSVKRATLVSTVVPPSVTLAAKTLALVCPPVCVTAILPLDGSVHTANSPSAMQRPDCVNTTHRVSVLECATVRAQVGWALSASWTVMNVS